MRLTTYELDRNSDAELWGLRVFRTTRPAIAQTMAARGLLFVPKGDSNGGETLFQIRSPGLDFYFEGETLSALTAGVVFSADTIEWPAAPCPDDAANRWQPRLLTFHEIPILNPQPRALCSWLAVMRETSQRPYPRRKRMRTVRAWERRVELRLRKIRTPASGKSPGR
jgi:hypothetical protein